MRKEKKRDFRQVKQVLISSVLTLIVLAVLVYVTQGRDMPVLDPKGLVADKERNLMLVTFGLGLLVIIPVFIMLFVIGWKYRANNTKAKYDPEFVTHKGFEALWWGIPCVIILTLGIITVVSSHALDPYKHLDSSVPPVKVQVVALDWKWLFIYPDQGIATLNYMNIPEKTPIDLTITSDAPMNSFWVPALAGQIYAMSGMSTQLHLMADSTGTYNGSSANISGEGFADMTFKVNSLTNTDFKDWVSKTANSTTPTLLTADSYKKLAEPSRGDKTTSYLLMDSNLYNEIIVKYMSSDGSDSNKAAAAGMNM
jgi:cytochrome o ubiquinol oxidase subunit 2